MTARSPQAYFLSALLHACAVAAVLLLGYVAGQRQPEAARVFELVAGAGDNYAATEAPALGVPGGIKVAIPKASAEPAPAEPQPPPLPQAEPVRPAPAHPAPPKTAQTPNFTKVVARAASRKEARLEAQYRKQLAAEKAAERQRETWDQYQKENGGKTGAGSRQKAEAEGIAGGVVGGSRANKTGGAGGKVLSRGDQDLLESYFALFKARLKENHVPPPGVSDRLEARIEFFMAANGTVSHVRVLRSSGNADFDQSVIEAFGRTSMPPRPDKRSDTHELVFRMRDEDAGE